MAPHAHLAENQPGFTSIRELNDLSIMPSPSLLTGSGRRGIQRLARIFHRFLHILLGIKVPTRQAG